MTLVSPSSNRTGVESALETFPYRRRIWNHYEQRYVEDSYTDVVRISWKTYKSPTVSTVHVDRAGIRFRPPTEYSRTIVKFKYKSGRKESEFVNHGGTRYTTIESGFRCNFNPNDLDHELVGLNLGFIDSNESYQAVTDSLNRLNEGKVQMGQFLGEATRTSGMLADASYELLQLIRAVKHGQLSRIPKNFGVIKDAIGNRWLQYQYGWKPLMSDIAGLYDGLHNQFLKVPLIKASKTASHSNSFDTEYYGNKVRWTYATRDTCKLFARVSSSNAANVQTIGLSNPASLAWEFVPYSFVLDWFAPVGDYLSAYSATAGLDFVAGYSNQKISGSATITGDVGTCEVNFMKFNRHVYDAFPRPMLYFDRSPFSTTRIANVLALHNQLRG